MVQKKTFRSIEFRDRDGDTVVHHGFMDDLGAEKLVTQLIESGATEVMICDLTPDESTSVKLHNEIQQLEKTPKRLP